MPEGPTVAASVAEHRSVVDIVVEAAPTAIAAGVVVTVALENGGYDIATRTILGVVAWWTVLLSLVFPVARRQPWTREQVAAAGAFSAFAGMALLSVMWAPSSENAYTVFARDATYLGVLLVAMSIRNPTTIRRVVNGLSLGGATVLVLALSSRFFPTWFAPPTIPSLLPSAGTRLSYPLGYWNALGILAGITVPLLLLAAIESPRLATRACALATIPLASLVCFLASSRGGFVTLTVGALTFALLTHRKWATLAAICASGVGSAVVIELVRRHPHLVEGPLRSAAAQSEGRHVAIEVAAALLGLGLAWAFGWLAASRLPRPSAIIRRATLIVLVAGLVLGIVAAHPVRRVQDFTRPPVALTGSNSVIQAHLLSGNGSGRWQFWAAAIEQFETAPVIGRGAGSYEPWWAQHGSLSMYVHDAHSLYLQTMGELGIVGLLILLTFVVAGFVAIARRRSSLQGSMRNLLAAVGAAYVAFIVAAGIDWMWEFTLVGALGVTFLGLLVGPSLSGAGLTVAQSRTRPARPRFGVGAATAAVCWLIICALAVPLLATVKLTDSQTAAARGQTAQAIRDAGAARAIQPWAASPRVQLALLEERLGHLSEALKFINEAIARNMQDWRVWLIRARLETESDKVDAAVRSLARARSLDPLSPIFNTAVGGR